MAKTYTENTPLDFQAIFEKTFSHLRSDFAGKVVVDVPAGQGRTSSWLQSQAPRSSLWICFLSFLNLLDSSANLVTSMN